MRIRLTVDLEVPDEHADYTPEELRQWLFDTYVNYVPRKHYEDAIVYLEMNYQTPSAVFREGLEIHKAAAKFTRPVEWVAEVVDK